jgi:hypothetical protein
MATPTFVNDDPALEAAYEELCDRLLEVISPGVYARRDLVFFALLHALEVVITFETSPAERIEPTNFVKTSMEMLLSGDEPTTRPN